MPIQTILHNELPITLCITRRIVANPTVYLDKPVCNVVLNAKS